jgi:predicted transglutaminase-like cysteine proteinase
VTISRSSVLAHCARTFAAGLILVTATVTGSEAASAFLPARSPSPPPSGARALCNLYDWACRPPSGRRLTEAQIRTAVAVNRRVNRGVREITDAAQYGRAEVWALPTRRGGDCEDFALMKKRELLAAGLPPERLLMASVLDTRRGAHAVLVLRTDSGDLILDNLTDRVLNWRSTGYRFLRMQNPKRPRSWITVLAGT